MDGTKLILKTMKNLKETSPALLMGDAVTVFKKMYSGPIKYVGNAQDVRDLVSYYYEVENLSHPLIIEDLFLLRDGDAFLLLKLVEEAKFQIVLLS